MGAKISLESQVESETGSERTDREGVTSAASGQTALLSSSPDP